VERWIIETQRLGLREMTKSDYPALCRVLQDPQVMYAYAHAFSEEEVWDWLHRQQERYRQDGFGLWALVEKSTDRMIGQCGLTWQALGDGSQVVEVGYLLERAAWHQGYATEAARACRDYAFEKLGCLEVYSIIRDMNIPSQAVAIRNGMQRCGSFVKHYYGMDMPHWVYVISGKDGKKCAASNADNLQ
jgi:ribosomal-protein-alanine N-acetyltransferase